MEKRKGLRAGISSIRQDYRSGGLVSKEGPRQNFFMGGEPSFNFNVLEGVPNVLGLSQEYGKLTGENIYGPSPELQKQLEEQEKEKVMAEQKKNDKKKIELS